MKKTQPKPAYKPAPMPPVAKPPMKPVVKPAAYKPFNKGGARGK